MGIERFKKYIDNLDEVFQNAATSSVLDGDNTLVQKGAGAGEWVIPMLTMDGLGDYDRQDGYKRGSANITYQTKEAKYDRGRKFSIDNMDNEETAGLMFGKLSSEFLRTKVVPELDAYRYSEYAVKSGIFNVSAVLATGEAVLAALLTASNELDEAEIPQEGRVLFITPTLLALAQNVDTTKSKAVLDGFSSIVKVPQTRFYTKIKLLDGEKEGEKQGGFKAEANAHKINFMIVNKSSVIQFTKHSVNKIITPELNQDADAWEFHYRSYGITEVYDNKVKGVYVHRDTAEVGSEAVG